MINLKETTAVYRIRFFVSLLACLLVTFPFQGLKLIFQSLELELFGDRWSLQNHWCLLQIYTSQRESSIPSVHFQARLVLDSGRVSSFIASLFDSNDE